MYIDLASDAWHWGSLSLGQTMYATKGNINTKITKQREICDSRESMKFKQMNDAYKGVSLKSWENNIKIFCVSIILDILGQRFFNCAAIMRCLVLHIVC